MRYYNAVVRIRFNGSIKYLSFTYGFSDNRIDAFLDYIEKKYFVIVVFFYDHTTQVYCGFYSPKSGLNLS